MFRCVLACIWPQSYLTWPKCQVVFDNSFPLQQIFLPTFITIYSHLNAVLRWTNCFLIIQLVKLYWRTSELEQNRNEQQDLLSWFTHGSQQKTETSILGNLFCVESWRNLCQILFRIFIILLLVGEYWDLLLCFTETREEVCYNFVNS